MRTHPVAGFLLVCLAVSTSWAQPLGTAFTYQGRLKNAGSPANGSFNMDFKLYPVAAGGTLLASQTLPGVSVSDGLFTVALDFGAGMFGGNQRWLEVTVNGSPLVPRQELKAAPYAHFALNADRLDGLDSTAFLTGVPNPLTLSGTHNLYIIGAQNLSAVNGASGLSGTSSAASGQVYGVQGNTASTNGFGVLGVATSTTGPSRGGWFECSSPDGNGVFGLAKATTGGPIGVYGQSDAVNGRGVYGYASTAVGDNFGVWGQSNSITGYGVVGVNDRSTGTNYGVYGRSASTDGRAVYGTATATSGTNYGVYGQTASVSGRGVHGIATATSGATYGVFGESDSTGGRGVYGLTIATTGFAYGVLGESASTSGRGVFGYASAATGATFGGYFETASSTQDATGVFGQASALSGINYGVWGKSGSTSGIGVLGINDRSTGTTYGVYGRSSSDTGRGVYGLADAATGTHYGVYGHNIVVSGFAVYANGNLGSFGSKSFRIDHPDDPANKYLLHYCAESPEVINFYSGTAMLDAAGEAVIELPHYFAKINKDPRYTLTAVGAPMPLLHVADEIDEDALVAGAKAAPGEAAPRCTFRIAGGARGAKVSWRVEAARNDRYLQQSGAPVEVEKQGLEKGTYQRPDLYGQPPEKGMDYDAARERPGPECPMLPAPVESAPSVATTESTPR